MSLFYEQYKNKPKLARFHLILIALENYFCTRLQFLVFFCSLKQKQISCKIVKQQAKLILCAKNYKEKYLKTAQRDGVM